MGRLAGFRYRDVAARLRQFGFVPSGSSKGSHEGWVNVATRRVTILTRHPGDMPEGTLRAVLRQAGISPEEFLAD